VAAAALDRHPRRLARAPKPSRLRWIGLVPLRRVHPDAHCVWRFSTPGKALMPLDPPRKFVAVGPLPLRAASYVLGMRSRSSARPSSFADRASLTRIVVYGLALVVIIVLFVLLTRSRAAPSLGFEYENYCRKGESLVAGASLTAKDTKVTNKKTLYRG